MGFERSKGRLLGLEDKDIGETFIFLWLFSSVPSIVSQRLNLTKELDTNPQAYSCGQS